MLARWTAHRGFIFRFRSKAKWGFEPDLGKYIRTYLHAHAQRVTLGGCTSCKWARCVSIAAWSVLSGDLGTVRPACVCDCMLPSLRLYAPSWLAVPGPMTFLPARGCKLAPRCRKCRVLWRSGAPWRWLHCVVCPWRGGACAPPIGVLPRSQPGDCIRGLGQSKVSTRAMS